jgi:hypothetical protein
MRDILDLKKLKRCMPYLMMFKYILFYNIGGVLHQSHSFIL